MPNLDAATFVTRDPGAYDYTVVGTAAGTTTISNEPCFFRGVHLNNRVASASLVLYDSVGTSNNVIGTIAVGTATNLDVNNQYEFGIATKNALTVVNSANQGATILFK